ncbi:sensor histidine kinase [Lacticaseibacillus yichunensis]|nr:histidine kinase [Lacticaseibacillus yichunensis]
MRYLLNAGDDLVPLAQEVEHAKEYLNIQRIRYGDDILQADFQIDARAADVLVPPLSIQTFVENTVKYAVSFDSKTLIKVTAAQTMSTEGEFLQLVISDNGPGYPPAILQAVADEHQIDLSEHHIGINNVIARLDLLYNHTYHLKLENLKNGGACTTLELPIQRAVKGENRDESAAGR